MRVLRHLLRRAFGAHIGLLLLAAATVQAQGAPAATPEAVAKRYVATLVAGDFDANAALMDPHALATIRQFITGVAAHDPSGAVLQRFAGVSSIAALKALSDQQVYARFLSALLGADPETRDAMRAATFEIIGHVDEATELTHVVYRLTMRMRGIEIRKVDVLTLRRDGAEWRPTLTADIENLVAQLSAQGA